MTDPLCPKTFVCKVFKTRAIGIRAMNTFQDLNADSETLAQTLRSRLHVQVLNILACTESSHTKACVC